MKIDVDAPWTVADADPLDGQTFESWLVGATASEPARSVFRVIARTVYCVEADPCGRERGDRPHDQ